MTALSGWKAMKVVRKHTLPYLHKETTAEHTWGVLHILVTLDPATTAARLKKAMYHDIGEYRAGDVPGDFKAATPAAAEACDAIELDAAKAVLPEINHDALVLTSEDVFMIKIADKIEFAFSCYHEWMLGNRYSVEPMDRTIEHARLLVRNNEAVYTTLNPLVQSNIQDLINEASRLLSQMRQSASSLEEIHNAR